jgi:hypothetical protein
MREMADIESEDYGDAGLLTTSAVSLAWRPAAVIRNGDPRQIERWGEGLVHVASC